MMSNAAFRSLVNSATNTLSLDVSSLLNKFRQGSYKIPDYQRDSAQWKNEKRSLFVESLINWLTIPPIIVAPEDDPTSGKEIYSIIDGQQRITTIIEFVNDKFSLATEDDVEYAENVGPLIQNKKFSELLPEIQDQITGYTLNLIILPKNLTQNLRLTIFRRINEGGVPLSAQDLRLAEFGGCPEVYFIRLAGIYNLEHEGSIRMLHSAKEKYQLEFPWKDIEPWQTWWNESSLAIGQAGSEMFLYFLVSKCLPQINELLASDRTQNLLKLKYDQTTISVLDLFCAQFQGQHQNITATILPDINVMKKWFSEFEAWFNILKSAKVPRIPVNSATKISLFIAAASNSWTSPNDLTENQWEHVQFFLMNGPLKIHQTIGVKYPSSRGKWGGHKKVIDATTEICNVIKAKI